MYHPTLQMLSKLLVGWSASNTEQVAANEQAQRSGKLRFGVRKLMTQIRAD